MEYIARSMAVNMTGKAFAPFLRRRIVVIGDKSQILISYSKLGKDKTEGHGKGYDAGFS
jgi:hypothetical protein